MSNTKKTSCNNNDIKDNEICFCSIQGIINLISKKWALLIISIIGNNGKLRFNELMNQLESISPKTLSDRLKELEKAGLLIRDFFSEIPPRVEYSLTERGMELRASMIPLLEWAVKSNF